MKKNDQDVSSYIKENVQNSSTVNCCQQSLTQCFITRSVQYVTDISVVWSLSPPAAHFPTLTPPLRLAGLKQQPLKQPWKIASKLAATQPKILGIHRKDEIKQE